MSLVSNATTLSVTAATALPSWVPATVGVWAAIPGTALSSVNPSPPVAGNPVNKIDAWTSLTVDTRNSRIYCAANGGHSDYSGNEVDVLILETNTPGWTQLRGPSTPTLSVNYYGDGRPTSRHSYYNVAFDASTGAGRILMFGGFRYASNAEYTVQSDAFNLNTNDWSPAGTLPNQNVTLNAGSANEGYATGRDPATDNIYFFGNFIACRYNRALNTITQLGGSTGIYCRNSACACDTSRNRMFIVGGDPGNLANHTWDIAGSTLTARLLSGAAAGTAGTAQAAGMVYVPSRDSFLIRTSGAGGAITEVTAGGFVCTSMATSGGGSIPATANGPFHKLFYVPNLKSVIYIPVQTGNCWALRVES